MSLTDRKTHIIGAMAVAQRGQCLVNAAILNDLYEFWDIDSAAPLLNRWYDYLPRRKASEDPDLTSETVIMGWSTRQGRIAAYRWEITDDSSTFTDLPHGMHLHPHLNGENRPLPPEMPDERLVKVAMVQHEMVTENRYRMCIGGVIHCTTITPDAIEQRIIGLYPGYDKHAAEFGCPNADEVAEFRRVSHA
ncbi:hypothetical protein JJL56_02300 [Azospirillum sp. YIM DDC1]|uniref:PAS domain-containing protein n=1 Tax=Azospirillum aestuarii TaxID=2802052 RepID=A0ABS1HS87_9PROT|nr:hypothetical protein [Azospirillum aestuarii]MBK4717691.1 hypothetical protein [Azospirillum aestuarii]